MKIAVAVTGYMGLSNAVLRAKNNEAVELTNKRKSPIADADIEGFITNSMRDGLADVDVKILNRGLFGADL